MLYEPSNWAVLTYILSKFLFTKFNDWNRLHLYFMQEFVLELFFFKFSSGVGRGVYVVEARGGQFLGV